MSRASRKRKSGRVKARKSRNSEHLEATNNMSARTNRSAKTWLDVGKSNLAASPLTNYLTKPYTRCSEVVPTYYPLDTLIFKFPPRVPG